MSVATGNLNRGLIISKKSSDEIHLSWRLLLSDPCDVSFDVFKKAREEENFKKIGNVINSTDYTDTDVGKNIDYTYRIIANGAGKHKVFSGDYSACDGIRPYISIPLAGDYSFSKIGIADLDGDGELEYVIKTFHNPEAREKDPYHGYQKNLDTYKLEAYKQDGTLMWRYDLGWSIELGVWYSPFVVYDLNGDGKAEVYVKAGDGDPRDDNGKVTSGSEYCAVLDGETGKTRGRIPWPERDKIASYCPDIVKTWLSVNPGREDFKKGDWGYSFANRNLMGIAYLDGRNPFLIIQRGTYSRILVNAYDGNLDHVWSFDTEKGYGDYMSTGAHTMQIADIDNDGCDEIIIGAAAIDHDGRGLWTLGAENKPSGNNHPDVLYVANIDPDRDGLEVFLGMEIAKKKHGICLLDAETGNLIWGYDKPTRHIGSGMIGNIDPRYSGMECFATENDKSESWLYEAKGELISREAVEGLKILYWDDEEQKEIVNEQTKEIKKYNGQIYQSFEGQVMAVVDCLGDWREEIITALKGEIRIYTTDISSKIKRLTLLQNRQYRTGVALQSMGYYALPQLGRE